MARIRNKIKEKFSQIPNELVFDTTLTDRARFLYVWMASKPEDWDFYMGTMSKELRLHEETVRRNLKDLINAGWVQKGEQQRKSVKGHSDKWGAVEYTITDERWNFE